MKDRFVPPELQALLGDPMIDIPVSGGGGLQSIGNGRYAVTLPDGQQVIVDQHGNIIGGGMAHPSLRFSHMTNFYP